MGRVAVAELAARPAVEAVTVADADGVRAKELAEAVASGGAEVLAQEVDVRSPEFADALRGHDVCLNAASYRLNLTVLEACLDAGCHYLDLGGLFHVARRSLELSPRFEAAGVTAVPCMGASPGVTNLMAVRAARGFETVTAVHVRLGAHDPSTAGFLLPIPYSLDTILDEFTQDAMVFRGGDWMAVPALSEPEDLEFPDPVGRCRAVATLHSEVATLPLHFRDRGIREVTFKIAFDPAFEERFRLLADLGLAGEDPVEVDGVAVRPREVLAALARRLPQPEGQDDVDALRVTVEGTRDGAPAAVEAEMVVPPDPARGLGGGARDTGIPPAVVAEMLGAGELRAPGVHAPEDVVPVDLFFERLQERGFEMTTRATGRGRGPVKEAT